METKNGQIYIYSNYSYLKTFPYSYIKYYMRDILLKIIFKR